MTMWVLLRPAAGQPADLLPEDLRAPMQVDSVEQAIRLLPFPATFEPARDAPVIDGQPVTVLEVSRL